MTFEPWTGRWRVELNWNDACHPFVNVGRKPALREARPATGCDATWRAYWFSRVSSRCSSAMVLAGTARPNSRWNMANGLAVLLNENDAVTRSRKGENLAESLRVEPSNSE